VLDQLGFLDAHAREQLGPWGRPKLTNYRGTETGKVYGVVVLDKR
jgi:hypothetical protein